MKEMVLYYTILLVLLLVTLCFFAILTLFAGRDFRDTFAGTPRCLCLYAYYEKNEHYRQNFIFFLQHGILPHVRYCIIVNDSTTTVSLPELPNVTYLFRDNIGYDFGAWSHAIHSMADIHEFDFYFFMNTSVVGPILHGATDWTRPFLALFDENTKLVGTSINIQKNLPPLTLYLREDKKHVSLMPHVQSMFFALDRDGFAFLYRSGFFAEEVTNKPFQEVIVTKEIGMSLRILDNGWNINCLLPPYRGLDYRTLTADINPTSYNGDPYYTGAYFGQNIQPEQVIFYKNTRLDRPDGRV
ncbi:hypothetical protein TSOC_007247 [Tetrabaena socialis]|uniref:Rhamnan synthesis protein F n=1 Tax=Tetrabaena socialis TaxID=47790 RepID=A0A2J8A1I4_9CHLO|nr:hypothetical protein TSOC_007247 [Tetrabaena socialis]|eukprot:PNH06387.1 hypothetical protein TSOC_007247 [Tetrabaena socialis]